MPNLFETSMGAMWKYAAGAGSPMGEKAKVGSIDVDITVQDFALGSRVNEGLSAGGRENTGGASITMSAAHWTQVSGKKGTIVTVRGIDMEVINEPVPSGLLISLELIRA